MLSKKDLIYNADQSYEYDDLQPLGTRKASANKPTKINIDLADLFLSESNSNNLLISLHTVYVQNGGKATIRRFSELIKLLQKKFLSDNNLNSYITAEANVVGFNNYVEALRSVNNDFTKMTYRYFSWNTYNPFHDDIEVGPAERRVLKKSAEIMPEDHGTLDVWREQFTQVLNRQFRDNNRIPVFRSSIHMRHYERSNEGLHSNDSDRASLETPIYGYDMKRIEAAPLAFKSEDWFGL